MVNKIEQSNIPDTKLSPSPISKEKTTKAFYKNHFVLSLAAVIFTASVLIISFNPIKKTTVVQNQQTDVTPTDISVTDSVDNWNTYYNSKYNFSLKYPQSWEIKTLSKYVAEFINNENDPDSSPDIYVESKENPDNLSIPDYYKEISELNNKEPDNMYKSNPLENIKDAQTIQIGGYPGFRFDSEPSPYLGDRVSISLEGKILEFTRLVYQDASKDEINKKRFEQILSTINFVDNTVSNTQVTIPKSWKTYSSHEGINESYSQFQLNYPSTWTLEEFLNPIEPKTLVVKLTNKNDETISITQMVRGGGPCIYPDSPNYNSVDLGDEEGSAYSSYVQIEKPALWRIGQYKNKSMTVRVVCQSDKSIYTNTTAIGSVTVNVKADSSLGEIKSILETIRF